MTSQLMVKINVAPFSQVNKTKSNVSGELLTLSRSQEGTPRFIERSSNENVRIAQLEQNIKFLQDQHQVMLSDLQNEIESLRNKNRDLQFQLIFNKTTPSSPQTPPSISSSDDEHKIVSSPNQPTFTSSLHVELLEKSINDLKIQLQENESRNVYLSAIVDEQKKKLEKYERDRERERERAVQAEPELRRKVEEADTIIRRLQQEVNTLRREGNSSVSPSHYHQRENYNPQRGDSRDGHGHRDANQHRESNGHQNGTFHKNGRGNRRNNSMNYRGNWFPPLHSQNYWQGGGNRGGNQEKRNHPENGLPNMNNGQHQDRRGGNNNHHHNGDGVRHRGGQNKGSDGS
ncbi:hrp65 protein-like isoform X2 [Coccinella septempunctata]|uniref:hrp65 protein-like isoform X2 n=1 Tax=Coccinella septempunctata TaxID=41139 RepID=UPI001D0879F0|nr:hrp65 protein-like isoform X2 [Coccinella septempunctata]